MSKKHKRNIPPGNRRGGTPRKGPQIITPEQDHGGMSPEALLAQMATRYEDVEYVKATIINSLNMHLARVYGFQSENLPTIVKQFVGQIVAQSKKRLDELKAEQQTETEESP